MKIEKRLIGDKVFIDMIVIELIKNQFWKDYGENPNWIDKICEEKELRKKAFTDIFTHKYFIHGTCLTCGKEYAYCTNKLNRNKERDLYCSDKCWKEFKEQKRKRDKERKHYQVFKDNEFYYIVINGKFNEKRNFEGKSWMKKSEKNKQISENILKQKFKWKHPILIESSKVPKNVIKIIDKVSAYLYDDEHKFYDWKDLKKTN